MTLEWVIYFKPKFEFVWILEETGDKWLKCKTVLKTQAIYIQGIIVSSSLSWTIVGFAVEFYLAIDVIINNLTEKLL